MYSYVNKIYLDGNLFFFRLKVIENFDGKRCFEKMLTICYKCVFCKFGLVCYFY